MKKIAIMLRKIRFFQKSRTVKKKTRRFRCELIDSLSALEKRVLLADISIYSPQDLAPYYNSANNTYYLYAGADNVTIASGLTIDPASVGESGFSMMISGNVVSIGTNVSITTLSASASPIACQTSVIEIQGNSISVGNQSAFHAGGNISVSGGGVTIGSNVEIETGDLPGQTSTGAGGNIKIHGSRISIGNGSTANSEGNISITGLGIAIGSNVIINTNGFSNGSLSDPSG